MTEEELLAVENVVGVFLNELERKFLHSSRS